MAYFRKVSISVTASTTGVVSAFSTVLNGYVQSIHYDRHGTSPLNTARKVTITNETTTISILTVAATTADAIYHPRLAEHGSTGAVLASTVSDHFCRMPLSDERLKLAVSAASSANTGGIGVVNVYVGG